MSRFPVPSFDHYWAMWNATDLDEVRGLIDRAVTEDMIFCDPLHWHVGRDALEANVRSLRTDQPAAEFRIASAFDAHHNRFRYDWHFLRRGRVLMKGFDVATIDEASGLIERVDGFFGDLPPLSADGEEPESTQM